MFLCTLITWLLENVRPVIDFVGQHCLAVESPWLTPRQWRVSYSLFHLRENEMLEVLFCFYQKFLLSVKYLRIFLGKSENLRTCKLPVIS